MKKCSKCKVEQPVENFWKQKTSRDGLRAACRSCCYKTHRKWVDNNREKHLSNLKEYNSEYYSKNAPKIKESVRTYQKENKERIAKNKKEKYLQNKPAHSLQRSEYYKNNKEKIKENVSGYQKKNKAKVRQWSGKRKRAVKLATPVWLTDEHWSAMNYLYWLCEDLKRTTGEEYHVDHIIPLRGDNVCGLHVPWNLQILPSDLNLRKGTKYD